MTCHKLVETCEVEWTTTVVDESGNTIFVAMVVAMTMRIIALMVVMVVMVMFRSGGV
jgi:hypothetical protein